MFNSMDRSIKKMIIIVVVIILAAIIFGVYRLSVRDVSVVHESVLEEDEMNRTIQLYGLCDSIEEAKEVADMYGIEFEKFRDGVAYYFSDKSVEEIHKIGKKKGYPYLDTDGIRYSY